VWIDCDSTRTVGLKTSYREEGAAVVAAAMVSLRTALRGPARAVRSQAAADAYDDTAGGEEADDFNEDWLTDDGKVGGEPEARALADCSEDMHHTTGKL
jgi:hypothetical protein